MRRVIVLLLAACSSKPAPPAQGSASGSGSAIQMPPQQVPFGSNAKHYDADPIGVLESPKIDLPKQESFRLEDAGTGAKSVLRYQLATGELAFRTTTALSSRQLDANGNFTPATTMPEITDGLAVAAANPKLLDLRIMPPAIASTSAAAQQYSAAWKALENRRASAVIDERGQLGAITFKDDPANARSTEAKHELAQRLLAMLVPVPAEPVGVGAKWKVVTILKQGPAYVKQTASYHLVERTPAQWKITVKLLRVAEEQRVTDPTLPKGAYAELVALFRNLEGTFTVDPKRPLVSAGSLTIESRLHGRVSIPGKSPLEQLVEDTGKVTFTSGPP